MLKVFATMLVVLFLGDAATARTRPDLNPITNTPAYRSTDIRFENYGPVSSRVVREGRKKHPKVAKTATKRGAHVVQASTGAKASVSTVARPHFVCLIGKLEAVGYRIDFMGGYASRGNSSAHPTGNALDINQTGRNIVTRRLPPNATELARDCGLTHGAVWSNPDQGHFEMPRKYGYVYHRHRTRYAAAR